MSQILIPTSSFGRVSNRPLGDAGGILILDMGEPVRILDLARDMITLSGFKPDTEMPIVCKLEAYPRGQLEQALAQEFLPEAILKRHGPPSRLEVESGSRAIH